MNLFTARHGIDENGTPHAGTLELFGDERSDMLTKADDAKPLREKP